MNNKSTRLEELKNEIKKDSGQGLTLAIFTIVIISLLLTLQFGIVGAAICIATIIAFIALLQFASDTTKNGAKQPSNSACEIVIRYNEKGTQPEHRKPDGNPLVITRRMQDALISLPLGTPIDFTTSGIGAKKVVLNNYDNTAFDYAHLRDGFRLTVKTDIPEGRARTTDISVDDQLFWLEFSFSHACP